MNSSLSEEEKQEELRKLEIVRQRQTIKIITVGDGCDDLRVKESFTQIEPEERSYGPKGYEGYRDSTGDSEHKQHVIIQTNEEVLTPNAEYVDIPMDLVNKTEEDLKREYPYWQIEKYSSNEIILYKEFNSNCAH